MTKSLQFSIATDNDVPQLVKLVNSAYRGNSSKQGWTTEADLLDGIRTDEQAVHEMIHQPNSVIIKCTDADQQLIGCVYLQKQGVKMYLGMLTILPSIQAQGLGKELLKAAEAHAKTQGCTAVIMSVISARSELIQWYERRGYHQTAERKPFPSDPRFGIPKQALEFLVMEKPIG